MRSIRIRRFCYLITTAAVATAFVLGKRHAKNVRENGPGSPINVSLTMSANTVPLRSVVMIQGIVTTKSGKVPVAAASVSFRINRPGGITTVTVPTDASGLAEWKYKAQAEGTYAVTVTASSNGAMSSAGPMTFTANREEAMPVSDRVGFVAVNLESR